MTLENVDLRERIKKSISEMEAKIQACPEEDVFERCNLEGILDMMKQNLADHERKLTEKAELTFKGDPVRTVTGIEVDFAAGALIRFSRLFEEDKKKPLITNIARGSFGFELELPKDETLPGMPLTGLAAKMDHLLELLKESADKNGKEEVFLDLLADTGEKMRSGLLSFLKYLKKQGVSMGFGFNGKELALDKDDVSSVYEKIDKEKITISEVSFVGMLIGALPEKGEFEFKRTDDALIRGKIGFAIEKVKDFTSEFLCRKCEIVLEQTEIRQKEKYLLRKMDDINLLPETDPLPLE